jgi:diguanylate cyclase (GGDEF)-like protein
MPAFRVVAIALVTAGVVVIAGAGEAFWLCVPVALLAASGCATRPGVAIGTGTVIAAAAAPDLAMHGFGALPTPALALLVPVASVTVLRGIQERLERERDQLRSTAHTDPLTGAENRRSLIRRIEYEIARHTRSGGSFTLVMLDVDGFKPLNDRFGHVAGDELLCDLVAQLKRLIRAQDIVARIGGDEFCVLAPETGRAGTGALVRRIDGAVASVTAGTLSLRASVGVAVFPEEGESASTLLHAADQRLITAKRASRGGRASDRRAA